MDGSSTSRIFLRYLSQYAETNIRLKMQEGRVDRIDAEKDVFREKMACNHFKSEINPENGYRCFDCRKSI